MQLWQKGINSQLVQGWGGLGDFYLIRLANIAPVAVIKSGYSGQGVELYEPFACGYLVFVN